MGPFSGSVQTQVLPEGQLGDVRELQRRFSSFIVANRRATSRVRAVSLAVIAVGLAFVASRVDRPLLIGLCGLVVIAPLVWLATALVVPMVMVARGKLGGGVSLQTGVEVMADETGVSWPTAHAPWTSVLAVEEEGERVHLRGFEPTHRLLFELVLEGSNLTSAEARREVVTQLERWRAAAETAPSR